jgi:hypothetical protein
LRSSQEIHPSGLMQVMGSTSSPLLLLRSLLTSLAALGLWLNAVSAIICVLVLPDTGVSDPHERIVRGRDLLEEVWCSERHAAEPRILRQARSV